MIAFSSGFSSGFGENQPLYLILEKGFVKRPGLNGTYLIPRSGFVSFQAAPPYVFEPNYTEKLIHPQSELIRELNLLVPKKQPTGPVKINRSHWFGKHILFYQPCWGMNNISGLDYRPDITILGTGHSTDVLDMNGLGRSIKQTAATDSIGAGSNKIPGLYQSPITFLITAQLNANITYPGLFTAPIEGYSYRLAVLPSGDNGTKLVIGLGANGKPIRFNYIRTVDKPFNIIYTTANGLDVDYTDAGLGCWVNGEPKAAEANVSYLDLTDSFTYMGWDGLNDRWIGNYKDIIIACCAINNEQALSLYNDPYQFLEPV